jgi:hypothetical protein
MLSEASRNRLQGTRDLLAQRDAVAVAWQVLDSTNLRTQRWLNWHGRFTLEDRSRGSEQLVVLIAGYKPHLWPHTLPRLERHLPADVDVCIVSPGVEPPELRALAQRRGWSWLGTRKNAVSLALNRAIAAHPAARYVHKLDEDIFIGEGYVERMLAGYLRYRAEGRYTPGFVAPVLNVNGFSYRLFLEALDLADAYRERFGDLRQAAVEVPAQADGEAAAWLWEHSLPFDQRVAQFAAEGAGHTVIPHRFSIGAILLGRELWEEMGGFIVHARGGLGFDEIQLAEWCAVHARVPAVINDVFAGHFSFGPQDAVMRQRLPALELGLQPAPVGA